MKIEQRKLKDLIPYVNNPRQNDHAVDQMAATIKEFGFLVPVLVESDNSIVDGHLRLKSAKKLKLKQVPCIVVSELSKAQIKALRININRMAELADWDKELLKVEIDALLESDYNISSLGFDEKYLQSLDVDINLSNNDDSDPVNTNPEQEFLVVVECDDEEEQAKIFEELQQRDIRCKIM